MLRLFDCGAYSTAALIKIHLLKVRRLFDCGAYSAALNRSFTVPIYMLSVEYISI